MWNSPDTESNGNELFNIDSVVERAEKWNLAEDINLLNTLKSFSENLLRKSNNVNDELNRLTESLEDTNLRLSLAQNRFQNLQNVQFIENRVYEEDETEVPQNKEKEAEKPPTEEEKVQDLSEAVRMGLNMLNKYFDKVEVSVSDSEEEGNNPEILDFVLRPKDLYSSRPLPLLIGSEEWHKKWHVGLEDSSSESEKDQVSETYSDTDSETDLPVSNRLQTKLPSNTSSELDFSSQTNTSRPTASANDRKKDENIFTYYSDESDRNSTAAQTPKESRSFADELTSKLGSIIKEKRAEVVDDERDVNQKPIKVLPTSNFGDLFSDEPPPLDDDFANSATKGLFSTSGGLFDDDEDSDLFSAQETKTKQSVAGDITKNGSLPESNLISKHSTKGLFDDDSSDDDMFSSALKKPSTTQPYLKPLGTTVPLLDEEPPNIDDQNTSKKPIGGVSIFGNTNLFGGENVKNILRRRQHSSSEDSNSDNQTSKVGKEQKPPPSFPTGDSPAKNLNIQDANQAAKKLVPSDTKRQTQPSTESDPQASSASQTSKTKSKKISLFDDNDLEDDLFGDIDAQINSGLFGSKTSSGKEKNPISIFGEDEIFTSSRTNDSKSDQKHSLFNNDDDEFDIFKSSIKGRNYSESTGMEVPPKREVIGAEQPKTSPKLFEESNVMGGSFEKSFEVDLKHVIDDNVLKAADDGINQRKDVPPIINFLETNPPPDDDWETNSDNAFDDPDPFAPNDGFLSQKSSLFDNEPPPLFAKPQVLSTKQKNAPLEPKPPRESVVEKQESRGCDTPAEEKVKKTDVLEEHHGVRSKPRDLSEEVGAPKKLDIKSLKPQEEPRGFNNLENRVDDRISDNAPRQSKNLIASESTIKNETAAGNLIERIKESENVSKDSINPVKLSENITDDVSLFDDPESSFKSKGLFEEPEGLFKRSEDLFKESGGVFKESGDLFKGSGDLLKESGDLLKKSGDVPKESKALPKESEDLFKKPVSLFDGSKVRESANSAKVPGGHFEDSTSLLGGPKDLFKDPTKLFDAGNDLFNERTDLFDKPRHLLDKPSDLLQKPKDILEKPESLFEGLGSLPQNMKAENEPISNEDVPNLNEHSTKADDAKVRSISKPTSETEAKKVSPGKLKHNLNINVEALLPGSLGPKRLDKGSSSLDKEDVTDSSKKTTSIKDIEQVTTPDIEKDEIDNVNLLPSVTKDRVRPSLKRRPSTRKSRQESLRNSVPDFKLHDPSSLQDNPSKFNPESFKSEHWSPTESEIASSERFMPRETTGSESLHTVDSNSRTEVIRPQNEREPEIMTSTNPQNAVVTHTRPQASNSEPQTMSLRSEGINTRPQVANIRASKAPHEKPKEVPRKLEWLDESDDEIFKSATRTVSESTTKQVFESTTKKAPESTTKRAPESQTKKAHEPTIERVPEPTIERVPEPTIDRVPGSTTERVLESTTERVLESTTEPVPNSTTRPVPEATTRPVPEPTAKRVADPTTKQVGEPTFKQVAEPTTKKVGEPTTKRVAEPMTKRVAEPMTKRVTEPTTKHLFQEDDDLFADFAKPPPKLFEEDPQAQAKPKVVKPKKLTAGLFDSSSSEDDDLFGSSKPKLDKAKITSKTGSLFGEDSDEELFPSRGAGAKKPIVRTATIKKLENRETDEDPLSMLL